MRNQIFDTVVLASGGASTGAVIVAALASVTGLAGLPDDALAIGAILGLVLGVVIAIDANSATDEARRKVPGG